MKEAGINYARVVFEVPLDKGFDYKIPEALKSRIARGCRVLAPFGPRSKLGYVMEILDRPAVEEVKEISELVDDSVLIPDELFKLARWMSEYYFCPLGMVYRSMLPAPVRKSVDAGRKSPPPVISDSLPREAGFDLNEEQQLAWREISRTIAAERFTVTLIHGVTGSGKTELYLLSVAQVLEQGQGAIILVPEISLTPQTVERVRDRFGSITALFHSRMSASERVREWERTRRGEARIVVGPRSAVFAPLLNPGLIIVDEEHERSYKQEEAPRYHARDVAVMRAKVWNRPVLLGSATPSLESYFNALRGKYRLVKLTRRIQDRPLPNIRVVDMRRESESYGRLYSFSRSLRDAVNTRLKLREQVILFLNRRGYAPLVLCPGCGWVVKCETCDQALTYHKTQDRLMCHLCQACSRVPSECPQCRKPKLNRLGVGTQRIEAHLEKLFPGTTLQRMDTDSTRVKNAHQRIFQDFREGKIQMLVGTQMIAKGLDFPNVTLVGVLSADVAMSLPDFRMGENTFQLLTQVSGRCGRGAKKGEVLIQTFTPFHPIIRAAVSQDYDQFYRAEILLRKELGYPPFTRVLAFVLEGKDQGDVAASAGELAHRLKAGLGTVVRMVGPQGAPIAKVKGRHRYQVIVFFPRGKSIHEPLRKILEGLTVPRNVKLMIDVDAVSLV